MEAGIPGILLLHVVDYIATMAESSPKVGPQPVRWDPEVGGDTLEVGSGSQDGGE